MPWPRQSHGDIAMNQRLAQGVRLAKGPGWVGIWLVTVASCGMAGLCPAPISRTHPAAAEQGSAGLPPPIAWQERHTKPQEHKMPAAYRPPKDPLTPVITFDLEGGFRVATPPGFQREPVLRVYADGRIVCGVQVPNGSSHSARLSDAQLAALLQLVIQDSQFLEITAEQVAAELEGYRSLLADGQTTTISVQLADRSRTLSVYALKLAAQDLPDAAAIKTLAELEVALRQIKQLGDLGGQDVLDSLLEAANRLLAAELPDASPWTVQHLRRSQRRGESGLQATLSRARSISEDGYNLSLTASRASAEEAWTLELKTW
jgi:hypothetical protein